MYWLHFILTWTVLCCTAQLSVWDSGDGMRYRLNVVQDVWLESSGNNGNEELLIVGKHPLWDKKRTLVQFDSITKEDCPIERLRWAKMYIWYEYAHKWSAQTVYDAPFKSRALQVHRVKQQWKESEATRFQRMSGVSWGTPWLGIDNVDAEIIPQDYQPTRIYTSRPKSYVEFDVTLAVKSWIQGKANYGLLMYALDENTDARDIRFLSSESDDEGKHPFVNVMCDYEKSKPVDNEKDPGDYEKKNPGDYEKSNPGSPGRK